MKKQYSTTIKERLAKPFYRTYRIGCQRIKLRALFLRNPSAVHPRDPFDQVFIDPNLITKELRPYAFSDFPSYVSIKQGELCKFRSAGLIVPGSWPCAAVALPHIEQDRLLENALSDRWHMRKDWEQTDFYNFVSDRIRNGETAWNKCRTQDDIKYSCSSVDKLIIDIKKHGFIKTQDPVCISIGKNGEYIKTGNGLHRILIGKISGQNIPVQVIIRHSENE